MAERARDQEGRTPPDAAALALRLAGHRLPGGEFVIEAPEAQAVRDLVGGGPVDAHPAFACIASLRTLGISIREMCELCDFDLADGPLLGECDIEFDQPLRSGTRYLSAGTIESYERVFSRRLGALDRLRFVVTLATTDGVPAARVRYLWLLPRGGGGA